MERNITLNKDDMGCNHGINNRVTCGTCQRNWCAICNPTPSARCPYEYEHTGDEYSPFGRGDPRTTRITEEDEPLFDVTREQALAMIGKVWAGNASDELFRLFNEARYIDAYVMASKKVDEQNKKKAAETKLRPSWWSDADDAKYRLQRRGNGACPYCSLPGGFHSNEIHTVWIAPRYLKEKGWQHAES